MKKSHKKQAVILRKIVMLFIATLVIIGFFLYTSCSSKRTVISNGKKRTSTPRRTAEIYAKAIVNNNEKLALSCWKYDKKTASYEKKSDYNEFLKMTTEGLISEKPEKIKIYKIKYFKKINIKNCKLEGQTSLKKANFAVVYMFTYLSKSYNSKLPNAVPRKITSKNVVVLDAIELKRFGAEWKFNRFYNSGGNLVYGDYRMDWDDYIDTVK